MIYLDHAATTMIEPQVLTAMKPYMRERFGNASTYYEVGAESRKAVEYARKEIADSLDKIDESTLDRASESFTQVYTDLMGKIGSDVGQSYYDTGMRAYQNETYEEAIDNLTKAYSYDNTNGDALFNLGNAYRKSGDVIRAIDTYQKVIESFPDTEMATRSQQFINELNNE